MLISWKAKALWNKFDKKASHKCYNRGKTCMNTRVNFNFNILHSFLNFINFN